ncbi:MAG: hypothetical protein OXC38_00850 [Gammaproteobacteria bacterium]|nr:hypothetical protein [Gammaproteobacteria bacterium]
MIEVTRYDCHDSGVEVAIVICGREYIRDICVSDGKTMPDRDYWRTHKSEIIKMALGLVLKHEIDENDIPAIKAIEQMRSTL